MSNPINDYKRDYIVKTFSRTRKKDYENYVLNTIWTRLNRLDLQPVTQQYVKFRNGKYGLVDLYFPQINYGVECDEAYHVENYEQDEVRELNMKIVLDSIEETSEFKLRRVKAYKSIESIHNQIDQIVLEINNIIEKTETFSPWRETSIEDIKKYHKSISIHDKFRFRTILEISHLLGKNYKGIQRAYFPIRDNYYAWCPQLALKIDDSFVSVGDHGWINYLSDDWNYIYETRSSPEEMDTLETQSLNLRVTFARSKDIFGKKSFRFIGVFEYDQQNSSHNKRTYKKIENRFIL